MRNPVALFCALMLGVAIAFAAPQPAAAQQGPAAYTFSQNDLSGRWEGAFFQDGDRTPFTAQLRGAGRDRFVGVTTEPNTFAGGPSAFLLADIRVEINRGAVRMNKTYNGVGGQSHTVIYTGQISPDGRRIVGNWTVGGLTGPFEMVR